MDCEIDKNPTGQEARPWDVVLTAERPMSRPAPYPRLTLEEIQRLQDLPLPNVKR